VSIEYEVAANAALRSVPTSTRLLIQRTSPAGVPTPALPVLLVVEALDEGGAAPTVGPWPFFSEYLDNRCTTATDCVRRYRVTAILTDPSAIDAPIEVTWSVVAETITGAATVPATAPAGGTLTLIAREPTTGTRGSVDTVALPMVEYRFDASNPGFVQTVTFHRPEGAGRIGGPIAAAMLRFTATPDDPATTAFPLDIRVEDTTGRVVSSGNAAGTSPIDLPPCETAGGCKTELRVIGEWLGGQPEDGVALEWSMAAFATAAGVGDGGIEPGTVALDAGEPIDLTPVMAGSADGAFDITGKFGSRRNVIVDVDPALAARVGDGRVQMQATLTANTTSRSGSAEPVRLIMAGVSDASTPGDGKVIVSRLMRVDCRDGRCLASFSIEGSAQQSPAGDVHVAWHLSIALVALPPATIPPGASVTITVAEPSS
jgi:hypothetical protein